MTTSEQITQLKAEVRKILKSDAPADKKDKQIAKIMEAIDNALVELGPYDVGILKQIIAAGIDTPAKFKVVLNKYSKEIKENNDGHSSSIGADQHRGVEATPEQGSPEIPSKAKVNPLIQADGKEDDIIDFVRK